MSKYLMGAVYVIEPDYTDEDIRRDLQNMKDCGFNLTTLWPVSNGWLAENAAEWVFTQTKKVLDICEELGIKALMQLIGQNHGYEFMPDALLTEDMLISDERGPSENSNNIWANLNHPAVREYIDRYFNKCITALKDHPAVYGWDVYNEAHYKSDDKYTVREYQKWLQKKYGDINILNRKWHRRYEAFSQINPKYRRTGYSVWSNQLPAIEYEKFRSENLTEICRFLYDTAKKYDKEHPIIIDGTSSNIVYDELIGRNNDEFETAKIADVYGATFYPKSWGRNYKDTPWTLGMYYDIPAAAARKAGKPYIVSELQTHTQSVLTPGSEVEPYELIHWMLMCIFTGSIGMQLWRWRPFLHGYQATGRGLTNIAGVPNRRSLAAKWVTEILDKDPELFDEFKTSEPVVKIGYTYRTRLQFDSFLKWGKSFWPECIDGWHKVFWDKGIPVDYTNLEDFDDDDFSTPVIVLPSILCVNDEISANLAQYVKRGGILIADARLGTVDYDAVVPKTGIPGPVLSEVFGVTEEDVDSDGELVLGDESMNIEYIYQILKTQEGTKTVFKMADGNPAVTVNKYGKGKAIYFNSFMGYELSKHYNEAIRDYVINEIKDSCGALLDKSDKVHTAMIESGTNRAMLAVNFSDSEQEITVHKLFEEKKVLDIVNEIRIDGTADTVLKLGAHGVGIYTWEQV